MVECLRATALGPTCFAFVDQLSDLRGPEQDSSTDSDFRRVDLPGPFRSILCEAQTQSVRAAMHNAAQSLIVKQDAPALG